MASTIEPEFDHAVPSPSPNPKYQVGRAFPVGQKVTQQVNVNIVKTSFNIHGKHSTFKTFVVSQKLKHNRYSVIDTPLAPGPKLSLAQYYMLGNPQQDDPLHHLSNSRQQVNHTPALHNVRTRLVRFWYKYNLSRVPVRDVVRQAVVDKPFQTIMLRLPPI